MSGNIPGHFLVDTSNTQPAVVTTNRKMSPGRAKSSAVESHSPRALLVVVVESSSTDSSVSLPLVAM